MSRTETTRRSAEGVSPEGLLAAIIETSDDAVVVYDAGGLVTSWNLTAERFFGYTPTDIVGRSITTLFAADVRVDMESVLHTVRSGDAVKRFETEAIRKDGMPILIAVSACPVFDGNDTPVAAVAVVRDITEQHLAQAALAEVEGRVRESEALAHVGSWLWDVGSGTVQWSDELHRIHGVDPLDFDGTFESHLANIHVDDRDAVAAALSHSAVSGRAFEAGYRVVRPDGEVRTVVARAQATRGSTGAVLGLRGVIQDRT